MKELIHFAHGNGFPSLCYYQFLTHLEKRFDYNYIDKVGHTKEYPVTENWHFLVDEVINSVIEQSNRPVIAVGHSLGGVLSFCAAIKRPELFKAIILLDAPIIGRVKSNLLRISKKMGMVDRVTPASQARGRRQHWDSKQKVVDYLKSRKLFEHFTDECLEDYIEYGMTKENNGYRLRFDRQIEYQIYRTIPHTLYRHEKKLNIPTALIYGDKSRVIDNADIKGMEKNYHIQSHKTHGTHMFPMEHPEIVANLAINVIDSLLAS